MQNEIGQIIIYPPTQAELLTIGEQYITEDKTERMFLEDVCKSLKRATDEYIEKTRAAQTSGIDSAPTQDIVTVTTKELDRIRGLYQDSFRYDHVSSDGITRFVLYWDNGEGRPEKPDAAPRAKASTGTKQKQRKPRRSIEKQNEVKDIMEKWLLGKDAKDLSTLTGNGKPDAKTVRKYGEAVLDSLDEEKRRKMIVVLKALKEKDCLGKYLNVP